MNPDSIAAAFDAWWHDSYGRPAATQARMTHIAFAEHIVSLLELMQPAAETTPAVTDTDACTVRPTKRSKP